jgi:hypothetical protein
MSAKIPKRPSDPSSIHEFDRAMRSIVSVRKSDVDASIAKERKAKAKKKPTR